MMKVKPFSYHIPPRRKAYPGTSASPTSSSITRIPARSTRTDSHSNSFSCGGDSSRRTSNRHCKNVETSSSRKDGGSSSTTPPYSSYVTSLSSLCFGVGGITLLTTLVLLVGFIGVAGQGKFTEMDGSSSSANRFQSHLSYPSLSHRSFTSLSSLADGFDNESDEALQQRISSMGHYGIKYRNDSYNYSSHISPYNYRSRQEYKLDPDIGTLLPPAPPHESLMSLHEDDVNDDDDHHQRVPSHNSSGKNSQEAKWIPQKLKRKQRKKLEEDEGNDDNYSQNEFSSVSKWRVPNQTKSNAYNNLNAISTRDGRNGEKSLFFTAAGESASDADDEKEEEEEEEEEDPNVDHDAHVLERFTPANSSHTSGKLRFRQGSQAEVDGVDLDEDSLFPQAGSTGSSGSSRRRPRRSVVHLYDMVVCSTGCNPLIFKGYGCYCGFLGSGLTVDGIDKCCAKHDFCYHHAKCPPLLTYFVPYYWRCDHGRPQCVTDFRGWKGVCGAHLCECDRQFAECLKKFPCPRSRAMCVTSPWSNSPSPWQTEEKSVPFTVGRRPPLPPWRLPPTRITPLFHYPPHPPLAMGRLIP